MRHRYAEVGVWVLSRPSCRHAQIWCLGPGHVRPPRERVVCGARTSGDPGLSVPAWIYARASQAQICRVQGVSFTWSERRRCSSMFVCVWGPVRAGQMQNREKQRGGIKLLRTDWHSVMLAAPKRCDVISPQTPLCHFLVIAQNCEKCGGANLGGDGS